VSFLSTSDLLRRKYDILSTFLFSATHFSSVSVLTMYVTSFISLLIPLARKKGFVLSWYQEDPHRY